MMHIPCQCGDYTFITSSKLAAKLPSGCGPEQCQSCKQFACQMKYVREAEAAFENDNESETQL